MADCTRFEATGHDSPRRLSSALRREARAERPVFSPALQERVLESLHAERGGRSAWPTALTGAVGGLAAAACVALAVATVGPRPEQAVSAPAATVAAQGIEVLPTPEEIGSSVLAEVATLAAAAVGVPELPDLAALDPVSLVVMDDPRQ